MALLLASGIGSILAQEVGKLAVEHLPLVKQVATDTAISVAKKAFDHTLDLHPRFANFLSVFGIGHFNKKSTISSRGKHRRISHHHNM
jgi:hypothetical protein